MTKCDHPPCGDESNSEPGLKCGRVEPETWDGPCPGTYRAAGSTTYMHDTPEGEIEATKSGQGEPWHIAHPWGDMQFYGSKNELKAECRAIVKRHADEAMA